MQSCGKHKETCEPQSTIEITHQDAEESRVHTVCNDSVEVPGSDIKSVKI